MNSPEESVNPSSPLRGVVALLILTALLAGFYSVTNGSNSRASDQDSFAEDPQLVYLRFLGRAKKLYGLLELIEEDRDFLSSDKVHAGSELEALVGDRIEKNALQFSELARAYNQLMEERGYPFTQRAQLPSGTEGPLPRSFNPEVSR